MHFIKLRESSRVSCKLYSEGAPTVSSSPLLGFQDGGLGFFLDLITAGDFRKRPQLHQEAALCLPCPAGLSICDPCMALPRCQDAKMLARDEGKESKI